MFPDNPIISYFNSPITKNGGKDQFYQTLLDIVDIMKTRIGNTPIELVSQSMYAPLYNLRMQVGRQAKRNEDLEQVFSKNHRINYPNPLATKLDTYLQHYYTISNAIKSEPYQTFESGIYSNYPSIVHFVNFFRNGKSNQVTYFLQMLNASLDFECALIALELCFSDGLLLETGRMEKEILPFVKQSLMNFGIFAILAEKWEMTTDNMLNPFLNTMSIKASMIQVENGDMIPMNITQLEQLATS